MPTTTSSARELCPTCRPGNSYSEACPAVCHLRIFRKGGLQEYPAYQGSGRTKEGSNQAGWFLGLWKGAIQGVKDGRNYHYWYWKLTCYLEKILVCQKLGENGQICDARKQGRPVGGATVTRTKADGTTVLVPTGLTCVESNKYASDAYDDDVCSTYSDQTVYDDPIFREGADSLFTGCDAYLAGL